MTQKNSDLKVAAILISSTLLLIAGHYHTLLGDETLSALAFYFLIPLGIIVLIFREDPRRYGLRLGDWRKGMLFSLLGILIMAAVIAGLAQLDEFRAYYRSAVFEQPDFRAMIEFALRQGVYMFSWEFIFRGFMLFGLKEKLGEFSILVQMLPFALLHFGKPEIETISTILVGIYFGYVCLRGNSYWPAVLMHLYINIGFRIIVNVF